MNTRTYRNFIAIADLGSISAAARAVHISQPSLSNQIRQLEREFGCPLLDRTTHSLELTEAGRILYNNAKNIVNIEDGVGRELTAKGKGIGGILRIGTTPTIRDQVFDDSLLAFCTAHPGVRLEIHEQTSYLLADMLRQGLIDAALLMSSHFESDSLEPAAELPYRMGLVFRRDHPCGLPEDETIGAEELAAGAPVVLSRGFVRAFSDACFRRGFEANIRCVCTSRMRAISLADAMRIVGVVPLLTPREYETPAIVCRPLKGSDFACLRVLAVCRGRRLDPAAEQYVGFMRSVFAGQVAAAVPPKGR